MRNSTQFVMCSGPAALAVCASVGATGLSYGSALAQEAPILRPVVPRVRGLLPGGPNQCSVEVVNRDGQVSPAGSPTVFNIPISTVPVRVRATCESPDGETIVGYSNAVVPLPGEDGAISRFSFDDGVRVARLLNVCDGGQLTCTSSNFSIFGVGQTLQLTVGAEYTGPPFEQDVTAGAFGTCASTDTTVATVSPDGLVTAAGPGTAAVTASVEGKVGIANIQVFPEAIARLSVSPSAIDIELPRAFTNAVRQQLRVTAELSNGVQIDVTEGSRFDLPTGAPATISPTGLLTATGEVRGTLAVSNSGATAQVPIDIVDFSPTPRVTLPNRAGAAASFAKVAITGNVVVAAEECAGVTIYEDPLGDASKFSFFATAPNCVADVDAQGNLIAVATEVGVRIVDISNPDSLRLRSTIALPRMPLGTYSVSISGNQIFVAEEGCCLRVWSIENPDRPTALGEVADLEEFAFRAVDGDASSGLVAVGGLDGIAVIDTRSQPWTVVRRAVGDRVVDVEVYGTDIYVVRAGSDLGVFPSRTGAIIKYDATDPTSPIAVGATDGSTGGAFNYVEWRPTGVGLAETRWGTFVVASDWFFVNQSSLFNDDLTANVALADFATAFMQEYFPTRDPTSNPPILNCLQDSETSPHAVSCTSLGIDPAVCEPPFPAAGCTPCATVNSVGCPPVNPPFTAYCYDWPGYQGDGDFAPFDNGQPVGHDLVFGPFRLSNEQERGAAYRIVFSRFELQPNDYMEFLDERRNVIGRISGNAIGSRTPCPQQACSPWIYSPAFYVRLVTDGIDSTSVTAWEVRNVEILRQSTAPDCVVQRWDADGWDVAVGTTFAAIHTGSNGIQIVALTQRDSLF